MTDWQPIETAPKDGTRVLLYIPAAGESWSWWRYHMGRWYEDNYAKKPRPYWSVDKEHLLGKHWNRSNQPTHWMPLPSPPQTSAVTANGEQ